MDKPELTGGYIFDIQGFSVHDGPGCRTLIFLKGCPLRCLWCSNPEGIRPYPEPLYNESKCLFDLFCLDACQFNAITLEGENELRRLEFEREKCSKCSTYDCEKACLTRALAKGGSFITVGSLYSKIRHDRQYWGDKGGITLTGGEPFAQPEFTLALLKTCFEALIHTAVETCGDVPWISIERSLPWLEWIFFDLKHMDETAHKKLTASSNRLILENARRIADSFNGRLIFRLPLVPGLNDSEENIRSTADFILSTGRDELNILPVHHLGREKYLLSGFTYKLPGFEMTSRDKLLEARNRFSELGLRCYLGSETPF
ncbi:MAG: glycyl-radical enzyme activating protein [Bacteroidetes bacterium]|nr:glycyl-radical enzyme activating protein [Bacteroidota bacterium]